MSFIQIIRDFNEVINTNSQLFGNSLTFLKFLELISNYFIQNIKFIVLNFFSIKWIEQITQFPIFIPKISESIVKENFFLHSFHTFDTIFQISSFNSNKFFIGFLNSFFLCLPFSCSHLIYLRRLLVQGRFAGISACLGNIFGQILFIGTIIFGIRNIIAPFIFFQPIMYIIGTIFLLTIVYNMVHEKSRKLIDLKNKKALINIFLLNFFLIWFEQSCIFQFFSNISIASEPTILESFFITKNSNFLFIHFVYLVGLIFGCIFFNIIFGFLIKNFSEYFQIRLKILKSSWIIGINFILLTSIVSLTFSSIPYYALEYLITSPLGFISQDKAFKNSIFLRNNVVDSIGLFSSLTLPIDVTNYDRGLYIRHPFYESFEDLNYAGEYALFVKQGYIPLYDSYKDQTKQISNTLIENENNQPKTKDKIEKKVFSSYFIDYPTFFFREKKNDFDPMYLERRFKSFYKKKNETAFYFLQARSFNPFFNTNVGFPQPSEGDKKIKQNFYSNPIYKFLLNIDIDNFLKRQKNNINIYQEKELYEKQLILNRYNDTLRFYNLLPYSEEFQILFNGTKSFADRVYNQQFKGTLKTVRRLFSISFYSNEKDRSLKNLILKYDQPLFLSSNSKNFIYHEELVEKNSEKNQFLEIINQSPFYIGWDDNLKKIVLTNRVLQKKVSFFENIELKNNFQNTNKNIFFTVWPIQRNILQESDQILFETNEFLKNKKINFSPLFSYVDREFGFTFYTNLPKNILNLDFDRKFDIFPPNRGGFVWPGQNKK